MEIVRNQEKNGIELYFNAKPKSEILRLLKSNHFRWHNAKKCWYIKYSEMAMKVVELINNGKIETVSRETLKQENKLGIKVGDIFYTSWGYEQTNVDFFQVVALKGKTQVVIKEVSLESEEIDNISGMSRDVKYNVNKVKVLDKTTFVKDNDKGMIKKVCGTKECPYLNISSYANAYLYNGKKLYESWYY